MRAEEITWRRQNSFDEHSGAEHGGNSIKRKRGRPSKKQLLLKRLTAVSDSADNSLYAEHRRNLEHEVSEDSCQKSNMCLTNIQHRSLMEGKVTKSQVKQLAGELNLQPDSQQHRVEKGRVGKLNICADPKLVGKGNKTCSDLECKTSEATVKYNLTELCCVVPKREKLNSRKRGGAKSTTVGGCTGVVADERLSQLKKQHLDQGSTRQDSEQLKPKTEEGKGATEKLKRRGRPPKLKQQLPKPCMATNSKQCRQTKLLISPEAECDHIQTPKCFNKRQKQGRTKDTIIEKTTRSRGKPKKLGCLTVDVDSRVAKHSRIKLEDVTEKTLKKRVGSQKLMSKGDLVEGLGKQCRRKKTSHNYQYLVNTVNTALKPPQNCCEHGLENASNPGRVTGRKKKGRAFKMVLLNEPVQDMNTASGIHSVCICETCGPKSKHICKVGHNTIVPFVKKYCTESDTLQKVQTLTGSGKTMKRLKKSGKTHNIEQSDSGALCEAVCSRSLLYPKKIDSKNSMQPVVCLKKISAELEMHLEGEKGSMLSQGMELSVGQPDTMHNSCISENCANEVFITESHITNMQYSVENCFGISSTEQKLQIENKKWDEQKGKEKERQGPFCLETERCKKRRQSSGVLELTTKKPCSECYHSKVESNIRKPLVKNDCIVKKMRARSKNHVKIGRKTEWVIDTSQNGKIFTNSFDDLKVAQTVVEAAKCTPYFKCAGVDNILSQGGDSCSNWQDHVLETTVEKGAFEGGLQAAVPRMKEDQNEDADLAGCTTQHVCPNQKTAEGNGIPDHLKKIGSSRVVNATVNSSLVSKSSDTSTVELNAQTTCTELSRDQFLNSAVVKSKELKALFSQCAHSAFQVLTRTRSKMKSIYDHNQNGEETSCTDVTVPVLRKKNMELDISSCRDRFQSFLIDESNSSKIMQKVHNCSENNLIFPGKGDMSVCNIEVTGFMQSSGKCNLLSATVGDPVCFTNRESFANAGCSSDVPANQMNGWNTPPTECKPGICKTLRGKGSQCERGASIGSVVSEERENVLQRKEFEDHNQTESFKCGTNKTDLSLGERNSIGHSEGNGNVERGPLHSESSECLNQSVGICRTSGDVQHAARQTPSLGCHFLSHEQVNELTENTVQYNVDNAVLTRFVKEREAAAICEVEEEFQPFSCQRTVEFTGKRIRPVFSCARTLKLCEVIGSRKKESTPVPFYGSLEHSHQNAQDVCTESLAFEDREDTEVQPISGGHFCGCSGDAYRCVSAPGHRSPVSVPFAMEEGYNSSEVHICRANSVCSEPEIVPVADGPSHENNVDASGTETVASREAYLAILNESVGEYENNGSSFSTVKHAIREDETVLSRENSWKSSRDAATCSFSEHSGDIPSFDSDKSSENGGDEKIHNFSVNSDSSTDGGFVQTSEYGLNVEEYSVPVKCSPSNSENTNSVAAEDSKSVATEFISGESSYNKTLTSASPSVSAFDQSEKTELPLKFLHTADHGDAFTVSCCSEISELVDVRTGNNSPDETWLVLSCNAQFTVSNSNEVVNMDRISETCTTDSMDEHGVAEDRSANAACSVDGQSCTLNVPECTPQEVESNTSPMQCDKPVNFLKSPGKVKQKTDLKFSFHEKRYLSSNLMDLSKNKKNISPEQHENMLVPRDCKEVARKKSCTRSFSKTETCYNLVNEMEDGLFMESVDQTAIYKSPKEVCLNSSKWQDMADSLRISSECTNPEVRDSKQQLVTKHVSVCLNQKCKPSKKVLLSKLASHVNKRERHKKTVKTCGNTQTLDIDKAYEDDVLLLDVVGDDPELFGNPGNWNLVTDISEVHADTYGDLPIPVARTEENHTDSSKDLPVPEPAPLLENERDVPLCHGCLE
ncbi:uncharacterized protein LOC122797640 [Protopterus annectens]|uniref:uncharacterized protein LOC122797640 n=1 Tax=Protopterus annectens TaxID=7888 RepID=UPI001CFAE524|nr:uncharacterized protein LOC122797640 [Protopterus annectens]